MAETNRSSGLLGKVGVVTTLIDAAREFSRGRRGTGLLLLVAAVLSSRIRGLGFVASTAVRLYRRFGARKTPTA